MATIMAMICGGLLGWFLPSYLEEEHGWEFWPAFSVTLMLAYLQGTLWSMVQ